MLSGRRLDLLDPSPLDIEIADIAHGLARVARWNGQTGGDHAFSVAQHSLLVEDDLSRASCRTPRPTQRLAALLHDAPEYVIGDMISPFKSVVGGGYKAVRAAAAARHPPALRAAGRACRQADATRSRRADQIAAYFEATLLAGFSIAEATRFFGRPRGVSRPTGFDLALAAGEQACSSASWRGFQAIEKARDDG